MQLGVKQPDKNPLNLLKQLYERLLQIDQEGRKAVVLIDEAQMLQTRELMEEFRGLLNLEIPGKKLLNIVFFGLPELEETMKLDEPLAQRVAVKYTLKPLSVEAGESYIHHRIQVAGGTACPFGTGALSAVHRYSGGVPRLINTICDNALLETFLRRDEQVSLPIVQSVAEDLGLVAQGVKPAVAEPPPEQDTDLDEIELLLQEFE
jgi:type II secretory pathway predicted ATPase ExeA